MAVIHNEPFTIFGKKVSIGAFDQGYFGNSARPTVALDCFGAVRFRSNIIWTDSRLNFGGDTSLTGGNGAVVFGASNRVMGYNSIGQGQDNAVNSNNTVAVGRGLLSTGDNQALFGQYNTLAGNVLLVVGDGQDTANRSDAFRVYSSGVVYANMLSTGSGVVINDPSFAGPLVESGAGGIRRGISTDANTAYVYGPSLQLATSSNSGLQPHLTIAGNGKTEFDSDCVFFGNVQIVGQTFSTVTQTYTTVASVVEASDPVITVAHGYPAQARGGGYDIGVVGERAGGNTGVIWDESRAEWAFIHTQQSSTGTDQPFEFSQFAYANLHVNSLTAGQVSTAGPGAQNGNLTVAGSVTMNTATVSNAATLMGPVQCQTALTVNGPSVMNTLFVANQSIFNAGLYPTQADSWPLGQNNNRFSRAFLDQVDVYDALNQDTYPARIGSFGEANVYLYNTSPAYNDTVGIYFDKGQSQLPFAKSAIVQEYDHWSLRTQGVNRLTANTVTGNLQVTNELVLRDNLTCFGAQAWLLNSVRAPGSLQGNTAVWSNASTFGGNLLPLLANTVSLGLPSSRFATACLGTADLLQSSTAGPTLSVGSSSGSNVYIYAPSGCCSVTFDNVTSATGKSSIVQDQSTLSLKGPTGPILSANTSTCNVTTFGDQLFLGNVNVTGQTLGVAGSFSASNFLVANAGTSSLMFDSLTGGNGRSVWTQDKSTLSITGARGVLWSANTATSNLASFGDQAVYGNVVASGTLTAANVYIANSGVCSVTLDSLTTSNGRTSIVQDQSTLTIVGARGALWSANIATSNVSAFGDQLLYANLTVKGQGRVLGPFATSNATLSSPGGTSLTLDSLTTANGKSTILQDQSTFSLTGSRGLVLLANTATSNLTAFGDHVVVGNSLVLGQTLTVTNSARVLGSLSASNVYISNLGTCSVVLDSLTTANGKSTILQDLSTFTLTGARGVLLLANTATSNLTAFGDHTVVGNSLVLGQALTVTNSARVLGSLSASNVYISNLGTCSVVLDSLTTANGKSTILQDQSTFNLTGSRGVLLSANTATSNLTVFGDHTVVGNSLVLGQALTVTNSARVLGSLSASNVYISNLGTCSVVLDSLTTANGKSSILQDRSTFSLTGSRGVVLSANTATSNLTAFGDHVVVGNSLVLGQALTVTNSARVLGSLSASNVYISNLGTCVVVLDSLTTGNGKTTILQDQSTFSLAGARGVLLSANTATSNLTAFGDHVVIGNSLVLGQALTVTNSARVLGSLSASNVYISNIGTCSVVLDSLTTANGKSTILQDQSTFALTGGRGLVLSANTATSNLTAFGDHVVIGNSLVLGQALTVTNSARVLGSLSASNVYISNVGTCSVVLDSLTTANGKSTILQDQSTFTLTGGRGLVLSANTATSNLTAFGDHVVVGNSLVLGQALTVTNSARVLGSLSASNVYFSNLGTCSVVLDSLTTANGKSTILQDQSTFSLTGARGVVLSANTATSNLTAFGDQVVVGNSLVLGQALTVTNSARVLGSLSVSNVYVSNLGTCFVTLDSLTTANGKSTILQDQSTFSMTGARGVVLSANTATSNLTAFGDQVVVGNSLVLGQALTVTNSARVLGSLSASNVYISNLGTCVVVLDSLTSANGKSTILQDQSTFSLTGARGVVLSANTATSNLTAFGDNVVVGNSLVLGQTLTVTNSARVLGSLSASNVYISNLGTCVVTLDSLTTANGKSTILQDQSTFSLTGARGVVLSANTATSNLTAFGDHVVVGNSLVSGQALTVTNSARVLGSLSASNVYVSNLGTCVVTLDSLTTANGKSTILQDPSTFSVTGARGVVLSANTATSNLTAFGDQVVVGNSLVLGQALTVTNSARVLGSLSASNVYISNLGTCAVTLDSLTTANGKSTILQDASTLNLLGAKGVVLSANTATSNLTAFGDHVVVGNSLVSGQALTVTNTARVVGNLAANTVTIANALTLGGNTVPATANSICLGNAQGRFNTAFVNSADLYDTSNKPLRAGSAAATNVYVYSDTISPVSLVLDAGGNAAPLSKSFIMQTASSAVWGVNGQPRVSITNATGNTTFASDVAIAGSLNLAGQYLSNGVPLVATQFKAVGGAYVSNSADTSLFAANTGIVYPSSFRVGDYSPPSGVLEVVQANTAMKWGGLNGGASDATTTANAMSFNVAGTGPSAWTFNKVSNYGNLATKSAVATIDNAGSYVQSSDERYKENVADISEATARRLLELRPRHYNIKGSDRRKYGLVAQEVRTVFPELVHENEAGFLSIDYMALLPLILRHCLRPCPCS